MIIGVFGKPRSGKSTFLARKVAWAQLRRYVAARVPFIKPWLNVYDVIYVLDSSFKGCTVINRFDVGTFDPSGPDGSIRSLFVLNESGINYNNKDYKTIPHHVREFFADHGHYNCDIIWDSQTVNVYKELRNTTDHYYVVKKRGKLSRVTRISYDIGVNAENVDICEKYSEPRNLLEKIMWKILRWDYSFRRSHYYQCFDSHVKRSNFSSPPPLNITAMRKTSFAFKILGAKILRFVIWLVVICCILEYGFGIH